MSFQFDLTVRLVISSAAVSGLQAPEIGWRRNRVFQLAALLA